MAKRPTALPFSTFAFDQSRPTPLYRQLYEEMREAILGGQLASGSRLPSTRDFAAQLRVSRNTVMNAYDQLLAEGYLEGQTGSGTYVTKSLPDDLLHARVRVKKTLRSKLAGHQLSKRGTLLASIKITASSCPGETRAFSPCIPALDAFPAGIWTRLMAKYSRRLSHDLLGYGDPAGYRPLREAVAAYLGMARAVRCDPAQVIIVSGAQQALDIVTRVLLDPGDPVWVEDPGYLGSRGALLGAGAEITPVPVDREGLDVAAGGKLCPAARLIYVSPSHQYPLGVMMSLRRRLALLEWASRAGAWIVEDDYDSEYRYSGRPLASLQGLDCEGRVIYLGTFSKVLYPSLRLAYMVAPQGLVDAFVSARALIDRYSPTVAQAVVADFITEGHFARHIRGMRTLYAERQDVLVREANHELEDLLEIQPAQAGLHLMGWLPEGVDDNTVSREAATHGVDAQPLSALSTLRQERGGLLLGYAAYSESEIRHGIKRLGQALRVVVSRYSMRKAS